MSDSRKKTVLVIDDDEIIRNMMRSMLTRMGFQVVVAENGTKGLEEAESLSGDLDLAIMDLFLPDVRGDKICPRIQSRHPGVRIIMMSGYTLEDTRVLSTEVHGFLQKPCNYDMLADIVGRTLG